MARKYRLKELNHVRLLKDYASWIYCDNCNETIGYLCYTTYDKIDFKFTCNCGSTGSLLIDFDNDVIKKKTDLDLVLKKNRLCCPIDDSALITILKNKLADYECEIVCNSCSHVYTERR